METEKWCMRCGKPCGECKHCENEENKTTQNAVQAARIREIYKGIELFRNNRTAR